MTSCTCHGCDVLGRESLDEELALALNVDLAEGRAYDDAALLRLKLGGKDEDAELRAG